MTQNKKDTKLIDLRLFYVVINKFCVSINLLGLMQFKQLHHSMIDFILSFVIYEITPHFKINIL